MFAFFFFFFLLHISDQHVQPLSLSELKHSWLEQYFTLKKLKQVNHKDQKEASFIFSFLFLGFLNNPEIFFGWRKRKVEMEQGIEMRVEEDVTTWFDSETEEKVKRSKRRRSGLVLELNSMTDILRVSDSEWLSSISSTNDTFQWTKSKII